MSAPTRPNRRVAQVAAPLRKQVIEELREAILAMEYEPGARLIERELCERFGVSRTVVREALRHLEAESLIDILPNHGPVVIRMSRADAAAVYEVREVLESLAAGLCAQHASTEQLATLQDALVRIEAAYKVGDLGAQLNTKDEFYDTMCEIGGNHIVGSVLRTLKARTHMLRGFSLQVPGRSDSSLNELRTLVAAITAREVDLARSIAAAHVRNAAKAAVERLTEIDPVGHESAV